MRVHSGLHSGRYALLSILSVFLIVESTSSFDEFMMNLKNQFLTFFSRT